MEKRINKKIDTYMIEFKNNIRSKADELGITNNSAVTELLTYVYDYDKLAFKQDDFMKRKRNKLGISNCGRCIAKRSNGEQCTRRKKQGCEFCGTHTKGIPHGICETLEIQQEPTTNTQNVRLEDINGIMYFIDSNNNVYQTEDVVMHKRNPQIIGKLIENAQGVMEVEYIETEIN